MTLPRLYSFRRCPFAMRARMALRISGVAFDLIEVSLKAKPPALLAASPKGTVPVLLLPDGQVIDESLDIMRWALGRNDPEMWLADDHPASETRALIASNDGPFKRHLDGYKYASRYTGAADALPAEAHRAMAMDMLGALDARLSSRRNLITDRRSLADIAIMPFVRQFSRHDPDWWSAQPLTHLQSWLDGNLASSLFGDIMHKDVGARLSSPAIAPDFP